VSISVVAYQKRAWLIAVLSAALGLAGTYVAYLFLGVATGVISMCASAPDWWVKVYLAGFFLVPAAAPLAAIRGRRWYLRRHTAAPAGTAS
jgi:hypothetical protein